MRMNLAPAVLVFALSLTIHANVTAQTPETIAKTEKALALKQLQGTWVPDLLVTTRGVEAYPLSGRTLGFDGDHFARFEGRRRVAMGTFSIDDGFLRLDVLESRPWDLEASTLTNKFFRYAYRVEGDILTLCFSVKDTGKVDDLTPGEGRQVIVYKRHRALEPAKAGPSGR